MGNLLTTKKDRRVIMDGLDGSGKTSLLYRWKLGECVTTIPTIGFNVETLQPPSGWTVLTVWDLGGRDKMRALYRHYYPNTQGIVWVLDSADPSRFDQARDKLVRMLAEDELAGVPLLILCNKQDLPNALSPVEIGERLELQHFQRTRRIGIVGVTVLDGTGVAEALRHLEELLLQPVPETTDESKTTTIPPLPDYNPAAADNPTLVKFAPIKTNTECPFAKSSKLWGGKPAKESDSLEDQARANCAALTRFVHEIHHHPQPSSKRLDGFCVELVHPKARKGTPAELGECVRRFLTALSDLDPSKEFCMRVRYIGARGWRFRFAKADFFVTTFAPCYPATSSRYAHGAAAAFVLLQPEASFVRHQLPPDTPVTHWDAPQNVRDATRLAFRQAGRPYHIPASTKYPAAHHIVKPLTDDDTEIVQWWQFDKAEEEEEEDKPKDDGTAVVLHRPQ